MDFLLTGRNITNKTKQLFAIQDILKNKTVVVFFFGAFWCSSDDCAVIVANLKSVYKESAKRKSGIEIIFVSSDSREADYDDYLKQQGCWYSVPYKDSHFAEEIRNFFGVSNIPSLIVCKKTGEIITKNGRQEIVQNGVNVIVSWTD